MLGDPGTRRARARPVPGVSAAAHLPLRRIFRVFPIRVDRSLPKRDRLRWRSGAAGHSPSPGSYFLRRSCTLAASGGGGWVTASGAGLDEAGSAEQATNSSGAGGDDGSCEWPALPADVHVREVFWTVMQKFVITSGEHEEVQHGYVEAAGFSFGDEKTWYSNDRKVICENRPKREEHHRDRERAPARSGLQRSEDGAGQRRARGRLPLARCTAQSCCFRPRPFRKP